MAVSPGQPVSSAVVNSNFISRTDANTNSVSIIALENTDPTSGESIANLQATLNGRTFTLYGEQSVSSSGPINLSETQGLQYRRVSGDGGAVVTSAAPFGTGTILAGTIVRCIGFSATNTVTIQNSNISKGALLNGSAVLGLYEILDLQYDDVIDRWIEINRNF